MYHSFLVFIPFPFSSPISPSLYRHSSLSLSLPPPFISYNHTSEVKLDERLDIAQSQLHKTFYVTSIPFSDTLGKCYALSLSA